MSHPTDGQLHAHLDGSVEALEGMTPAQIQSHLEACPDCATRLEAAREVRAAAASLLGVAVPSALSGPPFEEIQRRAASGEATSAPPRDGFPASRRFAARPQSLAWAASLAVALTAGWLARGMMDLEPAGRVAGRDEALPTETLMLPESLEAEAGQPASRGSEIGGETADNRNEAYGAGGAGALGQQEAEEDGLKSASEPLSRNAGPQTAAERKQEDEVAAKAVQETGDDVRRAAEEPRQPGAAMDRLTPQEAPEAGPARVGEGTERAAADPDASQLRDTADGQAGEGRAAAKIARLNAAVLRPAGPPDWVPVDRERAEAILGGRILTVDELPILSFHARESDEPPAVWTAQRLASGHTLDLVQRSVADDAKDTPDAQAPDAQVLGARRRDDEEAAAEEQPNDLLETQPDLQPETEETKKEAPPGRYELVQLRSVQYLRIHGFLIEARAPLSPDSLRSLLLRLEE